MTRFPTIAALTLLAACGDAAPTVPLSERAAQEVDARCEWLTRCGLFDDQAACTSLFRIVPDVSLDAAVDAGRVKYRGAIAKQCYDAIADASCDGTLLINRLAPEPCQGIFVGASAVGEACALDSECASSRCDAPTSCASACCQGTCLPPAEGVGSACADDSGCERGTFCGDAMLCRGLLAEGESCERDAHCGELLACVGGGSSGICRPLPANGERCPFLRCADVGSICDNGVCIPTGLTGAPCTSDSQCSRYGECSAAGACAALPSLGMPCISRCGGEAWCEPSPLGNTCVAPLPNGGFCASGEQCETYYCVDDVIQTCQDAPICF